MKLNIYRTIRDVFSVVLKGPITDHANQILYTGDRWVIYADHGQPFISLMGPKVGYKTPHILSYRQLTGGEGVDGQWFFLGNFHSTYHLMTPVGAHIIPTTLTGSTHRASISNVS